MPSVGSAGFYQWEMIAGQTVTAITVPPGSYGIRPHVWIGAKNVVGGIPTILFHFSNGIYEATDIELIPRISQFTLIAVTNPTTGVRELANIDGGFTVSLTTLAPLGFGDPIYRGLLVVSVIMVSTLPASDIFQGYGQGSYDPQIGVFSTDPITVTSALPTIGLQSPIDPTVFIARPYKNIGVETGIMVTSDPPTQTQILGETFDAFRDYSGSVGALGTSDPIAVTVPEEIWGTWDSVGGIRGIVGFDGWSPGTVNVLFIGGSFVRQDTYLEMSDDNGATWQTANSFASISGSVSTGGPGAVPLAIGRNTQALTTRTNELLFRISNATAVVPYEVSWTNLTLQLYSVLTVTAVPPLTPPEWTTSGFANGDTYLAVQTQFADPLSPQVACSLGLWSAADPDHAQFTSDLDETTVTLRNFDPLRIAGGYALASGIVVEDIAGTSAAAQVRPGRSFAQIIG